MIKKLMLRGLPALALCTLPVLAAPAAHSAPSATAAPMTAGAAGQAVLRAPLPLFEAIDQLPVAIEHREGYKRDLREASPEDAAKAGTASLGMRTRLELLKLQASLPR
ncbi:hypothetical protein ACWDA9_36755 [Streptomyces sp. NPDC001193]